MKSKLSDYGFIVVVLALMAVCVTGCASPVQTPLSPSAEPGPSLIGSVQPAAPPPQTTATPPSKPAPVLKELEPRQIRARADSWEKLVADTQPTFTWHSRDGGLYLLWVRDRTGTNEPEFEMDRAFGYQAESGKVQWILLATPVDESLYRELQGYRLRGMASVVAKEPAQRCDACGSGDWAMVLDPKSGNETVYQIGWEGIMGGGTGHPLEEKLLYVLKDKNRQWRFMGEGESNGSGKSGAMDCFQSFTRATEVLPNARSPFGLEIHFTSERDDSECGRGDPRFAPRQMRIEYEDGIMDGRTAEVQWSRPYVKAMAGETFDSIAHHLATWSLGWSTETPPSPTDIERHMKIEEWWRQELIRLNPGIRNGDVAEGTIFRIPTYAETVR